MAEGKARKTRRYSVSHSLKAILEREQRQRHKSSSHRSQLEGEIHLLHGVKTEAMP